VQKLAAGWLHSPGYTPENEAGSAADLAFSGFGLLEQNRAELLRF
jgi:hypothetical protein